jgi:hypothetical protein
MYNFTKYVNVMHNILSIWNAIVFNPTGCDSQTTGRANLLKFNCAQPGIEIEFEIETWLCLALLGFAWLCLDLLCLALLGFAWLCLALLGFAWLCLALLGFC